jgi:dipeptidyl aminopeptidase/acylaminoacyl peptidase
VQGEADLLVPPTHSKNLVAKLKEAKVPAELILVKNGNHVMMPDKAGEPAVPNLNELNQRVVKFFDEHLGGAR